MENFITKNPFRRDDFIIQNQAFWKFHSLKFWKRMAYYIVLSIIILVIGLLARTKNEPSNPFIFLGVAFSILTLSILYLRIFQRLTFYRKIKTAAAKFEEIKLDNEIEFSDDYFKYSDKEKILEFKWEAFSSFSLYKNFLFLSSEFSIINAFIFEKQVDDQGDFDKIYNLISQKVNLKK
jgi:hypothetical protein